MRSYFEGKCRISSTFNDVYDLGDGPELVGDFLPCLRDCITGKVICLVSDTPFYEVDNDRMEDIADEYGYIVTYRHPEKIVT